MVVSGGESGGSGSNRNRRFFSVGNDNSNDSKKGRPGCTTMNIKDIDKESPADPSCRGKSIRMLPTKSIPSGGSGNDRTMPPSSSRKRDVIGRNSGRKKPSDKDGDDRPFSERSTNELMRGGGSKQGSSDNGSDKPQAKPPDDGRPRPPEEQ